MRRASLTRTLTLRLVVVAVIAAIAQMVAILIYYTSKDEKTGILIALHEAEQVAARVHEAADGALSVDPNPAFERHYAEYPSDYAIEVVDSTGRAVYALNAGFLSGLQIDLDAQPDLWTKVEFRGSERFRVTVKRFDLRTTSFWVTFAIRHDPADLYASQMIDEMLDHVVEPMVPLFALMLLVAFVVIRGSLRPLTRAAAAAAKLDPRDHQMRLPADALPTEVAELVGAVNQSLARLQETFESQRQFLATAAHELRTPLAVLTLELDRLSGPTLPALRADVEHMTRLVNQLLLVARLDALPAPAWDEVDLAATAKTVIARIAPLAIPERKALELVDGGDGRCRGDADMIADALRNAVENAIRHAPADSVIQITVGPGPRLVVEDAGPGIPAAERLRAQQRLWVSPKRSGEGAGLGLFIIGKVIAAHNGTLHIARSKLGGASVEMRFVAAASGPAPRPSETGAPAAEAPPLTALSR